MHGQKSIKLLVGISLAKAFPTLCKILVQCVRFTITLAARM